MRAVYLVILLAALTGAASGLVIRKHIFVNITMNWIDAQTYCRNNYVDLSTIDTHEELIRFTEETAETLSLCNWIGLSKAPNETNFTQWSDGVVSEFSYWTSEEPSFLDVCHCVLTNDAEWTTYYCDNLNTFYCYAWEPQLIMVQEMKTWEEALEHCRTYYTDLMSPTTETDMFSVQKTTKGIQMTSFWIGLRFLDGLWISVNNDTLGNLVLPTSCPKRPFLCGAQKVGSDVWENKDCNKKMYFMCYHQRV